MAQTIPQRTISVSILGTDNDAQVLYNYSSPITGLTYTNSPQCDLLCNQPSYSLFVLDYAATRNGWAIVNITPYGDSPALAQTPGAYNLSILTFNPYTAQDTYRFYINYHNTITGAKISIDPQEGNVPP
jgi:hypothetical protein